MEIPILDGSALSWASEVEAAGAHRRSHAKWLSSLLQHHCHCLLIGVEETFCCWLVATKQEAGRLRQRQCQLMSIHACTTVL